jgi:hypothetical protein
MASSLSNMTTGNGTVTSNASADTSQALDGVWAPDAAMTAQSSRPISSALTSNISEIIRPMESCCPADVFGKEVCLFASLFCLILSNLIADPIG